MTELPTGSGHNDLLIIYSLPLINDIMVSKISVVLVLVGYMV